MSMKKPKAPKPTPAEEQLRAQQLLDLAELDEEENRRIKKLHAGRSPSMFRSGTRNSGRGLRVARNAAGGGSSGASAGALRAGGRAGGLRLGGSSGYRSLIQ